MVFPKALIHQEQLAVEVAEIERQLRPDVVRIRFSVEEDWSGETAVFFRVVLSDEACSTMERLREVGDRVQDTIWRQLDPQEQWGVWPHFNYRSRSEQARMNDPAWA